MKTLQNNILYAAPVTDCKVVFFLLSDAENNSANTGFDEGPAQNMGTKTNFWDKQQVYTHNAI